MATISRQFWRCTKYTFSEKSVVPSSSVRSISSNTAQWSVEEFDMATRQTFLAVCTRTLRQHILFLSGPDISGYALCWKFSKYVCTTFSCSIFTCGIRCLCFVTILVSLILITVLSCTLSPTIRLVPSLSLALAGRSISLATDNTLGMQFSSTTRGSVITDMTLNSMKVFDHIPWEAYLAWVLIPFSAPVVSQERYVVIRIIAACIRKLCSKLHSWLAVAVENRANVRLQKVARK